MVQSKAAPKKTKVYKIPEFDEPTVVEENYDEEDEDWLFDPPPAQVRSREHITEILGLKEAIITILTSTVTLK